MITFKNFLAEIDFDDSAMTKKASSASTAISVYGGWDHLFDEGDHEVLWQANPHNKDYWNVIVKEKDSRSALIKLQIKRLTVKVIGGTLTGVISETLTSREEARGKGLALMLYKGLIEHGQVLFSSDTQTSGSRHLWEKLTESNIGETFVMAEEAAARWYFRKFAPDMEVTSRVLLTGPLDKLTDEAYASHESRWLIVPKDLVALDKIRAGAIGL